jgi:hypothetical protein
MLDQHNVLRAKTRELFAHLLHGCTDRYCRLRPRTGGMHTNGGCKCIARLAELSLEVAAEADRVKNYVPTDGTILL